MSEVPVAMILRCPSCAYQHVDEGEWASRPHKTHLCADCGLEWRPFEYATVGVEAMETNQNQSEEWRKERMYGERDTALWAIVVGRLLDDSDPFRVVGSFLREEDADAAIADHEAATKVRGYEEALRDILSCVGAPDPHAPEKDGYVLRNHGYRFAAAVKDARALLKQEGSE